MILLKEKDLEDIAGILRHEGAENLATAVESILNRARNKEQQVNHQEGATKVLPPIQGSPNQGCNASRYPYN